MMHLAQRSFPRYPQLGLLPASFTSCTWFSCQPWGWFGVVHSHGVTWLTCATLPRAHRTALPAAAAEAAATAPRRVCAGRAAGRHFSSAARQAWDNTASLLRLPLPSVNTAPPRPTPRLRQALGELGYPPAELPGQRLPPPPASPPPSRRRGAVTRLRGSAAEARRCVGRREGGGRMRGVAAGAQVRRARGRGGGAVGGCCAFRPGGGCRRPLRLAEARSWAS